MRKLMFTESQILLIFKQGEAGVYKFRKFPTPGVSVVAA